MSAKEKQPNVECNHSAYNHAASAAAKSASLPTHALALHKHNYKHNNGVIVHAWHDLVVTRLEGFRCNAHLELAKRAARHGTSTGTARHGPAKHGTTRHGRLAMTCLLVPPCQGAGPGTALSGLSHVVPCHWARRPSSARADTGTISAQHLKLMRISGTITSSSQS